MVLNVIVNVISNTFFLVNKPFKIFFLLSIGTLNALNFLRRWIISWQWFMNLYFSHILNHKSKLVIFFSKSEQSVANMMFEVKYSYLSVLTNLIYLYQNVFAFNYSSLSDLIFVIFINAIKSNPLVPKVSNDIILKYSSLSDLKEL